MLPETVALTAITTRTGGRGVNRLPTATDLSDALDLAAYWARPITEQLDPWHTFQPLITTSG